MKAQLNFNALNRLQTIVINRRKHYYLEHPYYKGYGITTKGKVFSLISTYRGRPGQIRGTSRPIFKRLQKNNSGYLRAPMMSPIGGCRYELVHRLVAETFFVLPSDAPNLKDPIGSDKKPRTEVNHLNGNKLDNAVSNLEWNSHEENINHKKLLNELRSQRQPAKPKKALKRGKRL